MLAVKLLGRTKHSKQNKNQLLHNLQSSRLEIYRLIRLLNFPFTSRMMISFSFNHDQIIVTLFQHVQKIQLQENAYI